MSELNVPSQIQRLLDQMAQQQQQQSLAIPPDIDNQLLQMESQAPLAAVPSQMAQEQTSTLFGQAQVPFIQHGANLQNRKLGAENSLLRALAWMQPSAGPMIAGQVEENRELYAANQALMDALSEEAGALSFTGDAMTFVTEVLLTGKQFKNPNTKIQAAGRTAQEAAIGGAFGLTSVGMSDSEKDSLVAAGLLTGAIAPNLLSFVGRRLRMDPQRLRRVAERARIEKMFNARGLLTMGELTDIRGVKKLEAAMDNIPFLGLGAKRGKQREKFREVTDTLFERMTGGRLNATSIKPDRVRAMKESLADAVFARFQRHSAEVDRAYTDLAQFIDDTIASSPGGLRGNQSFLRRGGQEPHVLLLSMKRAARELLDHEASLSKGVQNQKLIGQLNKFLADDGLTFSGAMGSMKRIKEQVRVANAQADRAELTRETAGALTKLQLGLMEDMQRFSDMWSRGDSISRRLQDANNKFKDLILPFYAADDLQAMARGNFDLNMDVDSIVASFLNVSKPGRSGTTIKFLSPNDQDVARYLMLRETLDTANAGAADLFLRPNAFAEKLGSMQALWKETFSPEQQRILEGYIQLTRDASRAFGAESAIGPLVASGAAGAIGANKSGGANIGQWLVSLLGARFILGTRAGTDIAKMAAAAQTSKQAREVSVIAERAMVRWIEQQFPQLFNEMNPGLRGPYKDYNPFEDPFLQRHSLDQNRRQ